MSLTTKSYGLSYMILQLIFALIGGVLITIGTVGNTQLWGGGDDATGAAITKGLQLMLSTILFCMAQVAFTMALSTIFNEPKIANSFGGMIIWAVVLIPMQLLQMQNGGRYVIYLF